ncbi:hypothetical protein [Halorubrum sp. SP9]|uniref:hypothetical protein n=1 Tax=Halorubrum sp. SP9 TaxID=1537267 RepID=UPI0010F5756E|nr:hypothetical protein [Halorubrum sp. SP9]TKX70454.1 hypothetical protein EXE45_04975 [Halorubrum sp. SP9]
MSEPNPQTDARPAGEAGPADPDLDPEDESGPRDRPALLTATPDADAVYDKIRTLAVLAGFLGLLVTLIAVELLVRI